MRARFLLLLFACGLLSGCGNPAGIALTRGRFYETKALSEMDGDFATPLARQDFSYAIEQYSAAIKLDKNNSEAYGRRGVCESKLEQFDPALKDLSEAIATNPNNAEMWRERAELDEAMGGIENAISDYKQCLLKSTNRELTAAERANVLASLAYCEQAVGDVQTAAKHADMAISTKESPFAYCQRAIVHRASSQIDDMHADYRLALALEPHRAQTYQSRGYSEFVTGDYESAARDFETAMRLNPGSHDAAYGVILGSLAYRLLMEPKKSEELVSEGLDENLIPAKNAPGRQTDSLLWPQPVIQWLHGDIDRQKLAKTAGRERNKLTELCCYSALDDLATGNRAHAQQLFEWILANGNRSYIEFDIAKHQLALLKSDEPKRGIKKARDAATQPGSGVRRI